MWNSRQICLILGVTTTQMRVATTQMRVATTQMRVATTQVRITSADSTKRTSSISDRLSTETTAGMNIVRMTGVDVTGRSTLLQGGS